MGVKDFLKNLGTEVKVIKGEATKDKLYTSQRYFTEKEAALRELQRSRQKLYNVNKWSQLPGISSGFKLYKADGTIKPESNAEVGDFIYIDLPGPAPETWVKVIDRKEEAESAEFTVRPSPDPREKEEQVRKVEHFFSEDATSTFRVELKGTSLYACEIGKKEKPNNGEDSGVLGVVNTVIAVGGWLTFQELQWNKLTDYLVHHIEIETYQ